MIVLLDAKWIDVEGDYATIYQHGPMEMIPATFHDVGEEPYETAVTTEEIRGIRFRRPDGTDLMVGCSKEIQDIIGFHYEAWMLAQREMSDLRAAHWRQTRTMEKQSKMLEIYSNIITGFEKVTWWKMIIWAFKRPDFHIPL